MAAAAKRVIQIDVVTSPQARQAVKDLNTRLRAIETSSQSAAKSMKSMASNINLAATAAAAFAAINLAGRITEISDSMILLESRLKLVVGDTMAFSEAMSDLFRVSSDARTTIEATGNLYQRLALATKTVGTTHEELLDVTEAVAGTLLLSGTNAQEAASLMIQLSQAMAKGKLDGDEFRSVMENNAVAADILADHLGVTRGELFELSKAGQITTQVMVDAFAGAADEIRKRVSEIPLTFQAAFTEIGNQVRRFVGLFKEEMEAVAGIIRSVADEWKELISDIEEFRRASTESLLPGVEDRQEELVRLSTGLAAINAQLRDRADLSDMEIAALERQRDSVLGQIRAIKELGNEQRRLEQARRSTTFVPSTLGGGGGGSTSGGTTGSISTTISSVSRKSPLEQFIDRIRASQADIDLFTQKISALDELYFAGQISLELYNQELERLTGTVEEAVSWEDEFTKSLIDQQTELDKVGKKVELVNKALADGKITAELAKETIEGLTGSMSDLEDDTDKVGDAFRDLGDIIGSAFEDAVINMRSAKDIINGLANDIQRSLLRNLVTRPITSFFTDLVGTAGSSLFGGLFGLPGRATGGPVIAGQPYLVGERGEPEVFIPQQSGRVVPIGADGDVSMGTTINIYQTVQPGANPDYYRQSARQGALEASRMLQTGRGIR